MFGGGGFGGRARAGAAAALLDNPVLTTESVDADFVLFRWVGLNGASGGAAFDDPGCGAPCTGLWCCRGGTEGPSGIGGAGCLLGLAGGAAPLPPADALETGRTKVFS